MHVGKSEVTKYELSRLNLAFWNFGELNFQALLQHFNNNNNTGAKQASC